MVEEDKKKTLQRVFQTEEININNLDYYYTDKSVYCCDIDLKPMTEVEDFDYLAPIRYLNNYYADNSSNFYQTLLDRSWSFDKPFYLRDYDYDQDEILLQYSKCIKKSSLMIVWPLSKIKSVDQLKQSKFYKELEKNGDVHWIKELNLTKKQVQGVIYQVYYDKSGFKDMRAIQGKQEKSGANDPNNKFFVIMYKAKDFNQVSGKDAPLKVKLREILRSESGESENTKPNLFLHITDNHTHVCELAQLFCNKNSMRLLQYQRLDRIFYKDFYKSIILLMTYKNWLYQNVVLADHIRFLLFSSIVIYSLGLRDINDLDLLLYLGSSQKTNTEKLDDLIKKAFVDQGTKFNFVDVSYKKDGIWYAGNEVKDNQEWFETEWPNMYDAKNMDETFLNPKYHYYYFGVKIISMIADFKRRVQRARAAAYADLIALDRIIHVQIDIPPVPKTYWSAHEFKEYTEKDIYTLYKKIQWYLRKRYNLFLEIDEIKKYVKSPF